MGTQRPAAVTFADAVRRAWLAGSRGTRLRRGGDGAASVSGWWAVQRGALGAPRPSSAAADDATTHGACTKRAPRLVEGCGGGEALGGGAPRCVSVTRGPCRGMVCDISVNFTLRSLSAAEHAIGMWNFGGTM